MLTLFTFKKYAALSIPFIALFSKSAAYGDVWILCKFKAGKF